MTGYYCQKCNQMSAARQCPACGKSLPAATYRDVWHIVRVPAADSATWRSAFVIIVAVAALLMLLVVGGEYFYRGSQSLGALLSGSAPGMIISVVPFGMALVLFLLMLQGREDVWYTLENTGARAQTWHKPTRLRCWARLRPAELENACIQPDGSSLIMSKEQSIAWADVQQVKYLPRKGQILLFHTPHCAPLVLRLPAEEYPEAEALIKKACKGKG